MSELRHEISVELDTQDSETEEDVILNVSEQELNDNENESDDTQNESLDSPSPISVRSRRALIRTSHRDERDHIRQRSVSQLSQSIPPKKLERRKSSGVWDIFTKVNENEVKCNKCDVKITYHSSTSAMLYHIKTKHPTVICTGSKDSTPPPGPNRLKNYIHRTDPYARDSRKAKELDYKLGCFIAQDMRPVSIVQSETFQDLLSTLDPRYILPSPLYVKSSVLGKMYQKTFFNLQQELKKADSIAITTDGWTSFPVHSYLTVTCHLLTPQFERHSFCLDTVQLEERHTSENLHAAIMQVIRKCDLGEKEIVFVSDNAPDIKKAIIQLGKFDHIGCIGHTINLAVQAGLEHVKQLLSFCKSVVTHLKKSSPAMNALREAQKRAGKPLLAPIAEVHNRWNSSLDMFERLYDIKVELNNALNNTEAFEFMIFSERAALMKKVCDLLSVFKYATTLLSGTDYVTISSCQSTMLLLKDKCKEDANDCDEIALMKKSMLGNLQKRYQGDTSKKILGCSAFLDPRFKNKHFETNIGEYIVKKTKELAEKTSGNSQTQMTPNEISCTEGQEMANLSNLCSPSTSSATNRSDFHRFHADLMLIGDSELEQEQDVDAAIKQEISIYKRAGCPGGGPDSAFTFNVLHWWRDNCHIYPNLSKTARHFLTIPATSVPSESLFSKAGHIVNKKRSRLLPENVSKLVFLSYNKAYVPKDIE